MTSKDHALATCFQYTYCYLPVSITERKKAKSWIHISSYYTTKLCLLWLLPSMSFECLVVRDRGKSSCIKQTLIGYSAAPGGTALLHRPGILFPPKSCCDIHDCLWDLPSLPLSSVKPIGLQIDFVKPTLAVLTGHGQGTSSRTVSSGEKAIPLLNCCETLVSFGFKSSNQGCPAHLQSRAVGPRELLVKQGTSKTLSKLGNYSADLSQTTRFVNASTSVRFFKSYNQCIYFMSSYRKVLIQGDNSFSVWKDNMLNLFQDFLRALFYTWTNISYTTKTLKNVNTDFLQEHLRYFSSFYVTSSSMSLALHTTLTNHF